MGGVDRLVRGARAGVPVQEEDQQQDNEDGNERPAEGALHIHRRTAAPVAGRPLLTSLRSRRPPEERPDVLVSTRSFPFCPPDNGTTRRYTAPAAADTDRGALRR